MPDLDIVAVGVIVEMFPEDAQPAKVEARTIKTADIKNNLFILFPCNLLPDISRVASLFRPPHCPLRSVFQKNTEVDQFLADSVSGLVLFGLPQFIASLDKQLNKRRRFH